MSAINHRRSGEILSNVLNMVDVRVYQGLHFRFADDAARKQGESVARWAFKHFLRPVHGRGHHDHDDDEDCDHDHDR